MKLSFKRKAIIGMVHLGALPGTPQHKMSMTEIITTAVKEALIYNSHELDAVMIENMHDVPYMNRKVGPEIIAAMTAVALAVKQEIEIPVGIQVLAGANTDAVAIAKAAGLDFIRAEGYVFGHVADEGYMDSDAAFLMRYRKLIGADDVGIFTDIRKKHASHNITADVDLEEMIQAAEFFLSEGIIITGAATGKKAAIEDVKTARRASKLPVLIGSGISEGNIGAYWPFADGFIIGSSLKEEGSWMNTVDKNRVGSLMKKVKYLREN
ncbi:BtpA/SgcQ family protein [Prolixibacter sp. SD074]|uniref:BtpA/SgcQ family protein n=1 Tax=Prolixibacter sp. SD074 TaxID=2652391 RepID=UPI001275A593|nr:BtpA/SgcQ family protein [Prolixibacter sp. SD074]GET30567.1 hypothetical protein SD074_27690 [Prolixibacter sp. SD074]